MSIIVSKIMPSQAKIRSIQSYRMAATTTSVLKHTLLAYGPEWARDIPAREAHVIILCGMINNTPSTALHLFSILYQMILNNLNHRTIPLWSQAKIINLIFHKMKQKEPKVLDSPTSVAGQGTVLRTEPTNVLLTLQSLLCCQMLLPFQATLSVTGSLFKISDQQQQLDFFHLDRYKNQRELLRIYSLSLYTGRNKK